MGDEGSLEEYKLAKSTVTQAELLVRQMAEGRVLTFEKATRVRILSSPQPGVFMVKVQEGEHAGLVLYVAADRVKLE